MATESAREAKEQWQEDQTIYNDNNNDNSRKEYSLVSNNEVASE